MRCHCKASWTKRSQLGGGFRGRSARQGPGVGHDEADALWGRDSISGGGARVQASLHFLGAFQCCLHASACMAWCGLQCGVGSSHLMFFTVSEMSDVISVASQHPILSDVATKEAMAKTGEPMAPLSFRGFRLHTVWNRPPGGDSVHQVAFPSLQGEATASMLEYEQEKFSQSLMQGPKMAINLRPPSSDHWNIVSDLVLPLTVDMYKQRCEAKRVEQDPEGESAGAEGSPKEAPAIGKAPQAVAGGSKAASPTETSHQGERAHRTRHSQTRPHPPSPDTT